MDLEVTTTQLCVICGGHTANHCDVMLGWVCSNCDGEIAHEAEGQLPELDPEAELDFGEVRA